MEKALKPNDLMIGDWVTNTEFDKTQPTQVETIEENRVWLKDEKTYTPICYIQPIPLTDEILQKNLILYQYNNPWYQGGADGEFEFRYHSDSMDTDVKIPIRFVHQLQHALRLCGIEKEITL